MHLKRALTFFGLIALALVVVSAFVIQAMDVEKESLEGYEYWEGCYLRLDLPVRPGR